MSDDKALLAAIWEHPHEDAVRLVYADWLQENGQPERAEFVRIQIELARLNEWDDSPRKAELEAREKQLWTKHAKAWKAGLPKLLQAAPFRRGFVFPRRRAVTGSQFLRLAAEELAAAPLWDFNITQAKKSIVHVVASEQMSRVGTLELPATEYMDRPVAVFSEANFPNLASLQADANWIGEAGVAALVTNESVRHLRELTIYSGDLTDSAIKALASAPWFTSLWSLALGNNPFDSAGLHTIVDAKTCALRELGLIGRGVGPPNRRFDDESLLALFRAPHLTDLRSLILALNYVGDRLAELLCSDQTVLRLRRLNLDNNRLTDAGIERLAAWPGLATVETLSLMYNRIGAGGALALARSPHLSRLKALWLTDTPVAMNPAAQKPLVDRFGDAAKFAYR